MSHQSYLDNIRIRIKRNNFEIEIARKPRDQVTSRPPNDPFPRPRSHDRDPVVFETLFVPGGYPRATPPVTTRRTACQRCRERRLRSTNITNRRLAFPKTCRLKRAAVTTQWSSRRRKDEENPKRRTRETKTCRPRTRSERSSDGTVEPRRRPYRTDTRTRTHRRGRTTEIT